jgi:galactan endo-1,6-beta-galactosidase
MIEDNRTEKGRIQVHAARHQSRHYLRTGSLTRFRAVTGKVGALLLAFAGLLTSVRCEAEPCVLDPGNTQGKWDGWGTSLCWFAKVFGDRDDLADVLFTTNLVTLDDQSLPGLGLNIVRYNAGACSTNAVGGRSMVLSRAVPRWKQIEGFWLHPQSEDPQSTSWDWSVDANQRALLQKARDRGADRFELFSNSPMWWMCGNFNPSGAAQATDDNLPPENYEKFAVYLATIAQYAREHWGVSFTSVEPFNEPISAYWSASGRQEGCHFSHASQAAVIKLLRAELNERGLHGLAIAASDENQYDEAVDTWRRFDDSTRALVDQINVHGYQGEKGRRQELSQITRGKRLWNSEYGNGEPDGLDLARDVHLDFQFLRPTAWAYWQPLDDGNRGGWGLLPVNMRRATIGRANPKYFVLAQYSRHIRPGMLILTTGDAESVAAFDPIGRKLIIVALNNTATRGEKTYDLAKFELTASTVRSWITQPLGDARYQPQSPEASGTKLVVSLPPHSIQTFELAVQVRPPKPLPDGHTNDSSLRAVGEPVINSAEPSRKN